MDIKKKKKEQKIAGDKLENSIEKGFGFLLGKVESS